MTSTSSRRQVSTADRTPVVSWVLRQGTAAITCGIEMKADRSFELSVVPSWSRRSSLVEQFPGAVAAMERHAQVADRLRDLGWSVTRSAR